MIRTAPTCVKEKSAQFRRFAAPRAPASNHAVERVNVPLVLASGSPYRAELLSRICERFEVRPGHVDESALPGESGGALASRLARAKAGAALAAATHDGRQRRELVIGSDQVADLGGRTLGKPGSVDANIAMLSRCSGRRVTFHTAVWVIDSAQPDAPLTHVDVTEVHFRRLNRDEITAYVRRDQALDCAGGFKLEKAGITLFEKVITEDPTAILGLPMIWLAGALRRFGWHLAGSH